MKFSIATSLILAIITIYLIVRSSKRASSNKYERKPRDSWNSLSEGIDPTDD